MGSADNPQRETQAEQLARYEALYRKWAAEDWIALQHIATSSTWQAVAIRIAIEAAHR